MLVRIVHKSSDCLDRYGSLKYAVGMYTTRLMVLHFHRHLHQSYNDYPFFLVFALLLA